MVLENYNLETKHYVILAVLGIVELVLFALMFYNCFLELRQKRRQRKYKYTNVEKHKHTCHGGGRDVEESSSGINCSAPTCSAHNNVKPTLMEIFSVDMTLRRDNTFDTTTDTVIPLRNYHPLKHEDPRPCRHSF